MCVKLEPVSNNNDDKAYNNNTDRGDENTDNDHDAGCNNNADSYSDNSDSDGKNANNDSNTYSDNDNIDSDDNTESDNEHKRSLPNPSPHHPTSRVATSLLPFRLSVYQHYLPASLSQSRIDGRSGSSACTLIAAEVCALW